MEKEKENGKILPIERKVIIQNCRCGVGVGIRGLLLALIFLNGWGGERKYVTHILSVEKTTNGFGVEVRYMNT